MNASLVRAHCATTVSGSGQTLNIQREVTECKSPEISENLQSFGDYLRGFGEFGQRNLILYPLCHGRFLCAQSAN